MRGRGGFGRRLTWHPLVSRRRSILPRWTGCIGVLISFMMIGVLASIKPFFIK